MGRVTVAIALGSSLGDRAAHLAFARDRLRDLLADLRMSAVIETDPVDVPGEQTPFLNAALVGETDLPARDLLAALHDIERARDRQRPYRNAPRTLDLDLVLYGDQVIDDAAPRAGQVAPDRERTSGDAAPLVVPHPRFRERAFVLDPLAEVAPDLVDPVTGLTIAQLRDRLPR